MAVSFFLASLAAQPSVVELRVNPPQGMTRTYRTETAFTIQAVKFTYRSTVEEVHEGLREGSAAYTQTLKEGTLIVPGSRIPLTDPPRSLRLSELGRPLRVEGESSDALRLRRLTAVPLPEKKVKVGDAWEFRFPPDTDAVPDLRGTVKLLALENLMGIASAKISFSCKEVSTGEASSSGAGWIDLATGLPLKLRVELKKAPFAQSITDGVWSMAVVPASSPPTPPTKPN